ncbi:multi-sensor hybrid histidine kinase [Hydrogenophaga taeniospiralis CCUG 15921]|uniref:histidine kinase n=1 Tax=Hydrogenophaga taeniospiralis CCUG 15921 TaxID=1281780 RepID=A0A9X4NPD5_9BURK|nr:MASE3 domain-containing protein [Hydrogenophaga taeniospiralis]MDG5975173.1 multi-sensor hybrid histidine kinase [Hydrogenophaga taeniospiralis CCUG 15921]
MLSLMAVLGMVAIVNAPPDTARGLLSGRMLELHLVLELFAIVIATLVVVVSWHTFDRQQDHSANALLAGFVAVIGFDLMHALTYEGMPPLLTESSTPRAIFFWLMGRSFEVLTLGAVAAGLALRWPRTVLLGVGLVVAVAIIAFGSFSLDRFPVTFVPGVGVTPFKAGYEYVLVGLNGLLALVLWRRAKREQSRQHALLALSCLCMGLGGFAFTAYVTPSDFQNVVGHLYKVAAYALLYRATFITSIRAPFEALRISEARVRESQARMHLLGANLPHSVLYQLVMEADGRRRFTEVSDSVARVCGVTVAEVLADPRAMYGLVHPDDVAALAVAEQRCAEALQVFDVEARFCRPDGSVRRMHLVSAPRALGESRIVWDGLLTDVTDRTEAQEARRRLEQQLGEAQKMESIGTLASGIAHDFNNVLAAILGNAHMAREDLKSGKPADVALSLDQIIKASDRARNLVDRILSFSRRDGARRQVQPLLPVLRESLSLLRSTLPAGVQLIECIDDPEASAEIDRTQLEQVLLNLCTNAWHALGERGGRIEVRLGSVVLDAAASMPLGLLPGRHARLSVQDNGSGMSEPVRQRIFEPFFTTKPVGQGTGLGLSVVHGIVRAHDGAIDVHSQPGQGTRFDIFIPTPPGTVAPTLAADAAAQSDAEPGRGEHVLLIEDDPLMSAMLEKLLARHGYRVSHHNDPDQAMAAVRADPQAFDLVVTDYNMPRHSGLEVIATIRRLRPGLPTILISGYVTDELRARAAVQGMCHVLEKTRALDELVTLLAQTLRSAGAQVAEA